MLEWIVGRVEGTANAIETPVGLQPADGSINLDGLDLGEEARALLFGFDRAGWQAEFEGIAGYLADYGIRMPTDLMQEQARIAKALIDDTP